MTTPLRPGDPGFMGPVTADQKRDGYLRAVDAQVRSEYGGSIPDIKFDRAGVDKVIQRVKELRIKHLEPAMDNVDRLYSVSPPGAEYASAGFANRANAAGESYRDYLKAKIQGLKDYEDLLEKIRDKYLQDEEDQAGSFNRTES